MAAIRFMLNGESETVDVEPQMPLLWVLRDTLSLNGTKFGCGIAACGACTVHLDDAAVRACVTPISAVAGRTVTTIEGIEGGVAEALQRAWEQIDVPQCGYCQPGQVMSAMGLLASNANPTDEQINVAMRGNLCRCGTYQDIRKAIHRAAEDVAEDSQGEVS